MKIEHIAIYTKDLERLKDYYVKFFNGKSNSKYFNPKTEFESYFISFKTGCRLELMTIPNIADKGIDKFNCQGFAHLAFELETKLEVDSKARELELAGFSIVKTPRITGDGYYEFETIDIDGNKIEVTARQTH
jgi:lactoylglutathione lyase